MGRMGQRGGLFQYLSEINYDRMINCEQWKDKLCVILCIIKRNYVSEKMSIKRAYASEKMTIKRNYASEKFITKNIIVI